MPALYNEIDPYAAQWTRNLIDQGLVAPGFVEERSIADLRAEDLAGYTQHHFFSGIAVWSAALRLAGWPDDAEITSGSCPCQGWSTAGRKRGFDDERHLWPEWFRLIRDYRPPVIVGEQVASPDVVGSASAKPRRGAKAEPRRTWLDLVHDDLEGIDYSVGAVVFPACGVGAPHIRSRTYFVALADGERLERVRVQLRERRSREAVSQTRGVREVEWVADSERDGRGPGWLGESHGRETLEPDRHGDALVVAHDCGEGREGSAQRTRGRDGSLERVRTSGVGDSSGARFRDAEDAGTDRGDAAPRAEASGRRTTRDLEPERAGATRLVGDPGASGAGRDGGAVPGAEAETQREGRFEYRRIRHGVIPPGPTRGFWEHADWLICRDGKARPIKPSTFALADGTRGRVVIRRPDGVTHEYPRAAALRGCGNAIVRQQAAAFVSSVIDVLLEEP